MAAARGSSGGFLAVPAALALLIGVFAPLGDVDVYGPVSLFDISETQAVIVLCAAVAALVSVFAFQGRALALCALGAWAGLLYPLLRDWLGLQDDSALGQLKQAAGRLAGDLFGDIVADIAMDATRLSWGGFALLGGSLLLSVAAWRRRGGGRRRG